MFSRENDVGVNFVSPRSFGLLPSRCIDLPTDELLKVIISKNFSDKQVIIDGKILEYIIKNIDRSYEAVFDLIDKLDEFSLSTGKSININLIKKALNK